MSLEIIHASCIAIGDAGVLIEGRSGAGKSDLALRLIDRGAALVSDDYTELRREGTALVARPPAGLAGKIEVRGIGIVAMAYVEDIAVRLLVAIDGDPPRLPDPPAVRTIGGVTLRAIALPALEPSAPVKVELALRQELAA